MAELPTVCRRCEDRRRMRGNFLCATCHPETTPEDYEGEYA